MYHFNQLVAVSSDEVLDNMLETMEALQAEQVYAGMPLNAIHNHKYQLIIEIMLAEVTVRMERTGYTNNSSSQFIS